MIFNSKKITLGILTACILLLVFSSPVLGMANPEDYTYTVSDGSATITGYTGTATWIYIPPILGSYFVEAIDAEALSNMGFWEVSIPASVTSIGENAFAGNPEGLTIFGEPGSAAEAYAVANDHRYENKSWTAEKTASHDSVTLDIGESATITYTIVSTLHSIVDTTSTYDSSLIWDGVVYSWWDASADEGLVTMSIDGFEIQRPSSSIERLSRGNNESRTDSYELTITNVDAEAGKTFSLGNYAFVFNSDGFPYDWTANLVAVTTPGGDVPVETPVPEEGIVEEEEAVDDEAEEEAADEEEDEELPQTGIPVNYGLGLLLLAGGAITIIRSRK